MLALFIFYVVMTAIIRVIRPEKRHLWRCNRLFWDIRKTDNFALMFYIFYLFKRILYAVIISSFYAQSRMPFNLTVFFVHGVGIAYMTAARPFEDWLVNIHMIFNEVNELFITTLIFNYVDPHLFDLEFFNYAKVGIYSFAFVDCYR